ncbi:MAG: hypothetical protein KME16_11865 [Scytolyngbya sp. HA4215-MV1]|jgi:hypothetical protein|nr:hypothetical protein [Scytolyngbya sp. HA4215-MV1]
MSGHPSLVAFFLPQSSRSWMRFCLILSLVVCLVCGILQLRQAFSGEYVVQDDARQHVFWMRRFLDAQLFQHDWIADYYQSAAPWGYTAIYRLTAMVGIDPIFLSKLLPIGLGLLSTVYCFGICIELVPVPWVGFWGALFLNQSLWSYEDLVSSTARSFVYPLFLAFLYYLLRGALLPCLVAIALQGLIYPPGLLTSAGILVIRLLCWQEGKLQFSRQRRDYLFCLSGLLVTILVLLPTLLESSTFGPTVSVAEARTMPEFLPAGRAEFFVTSKIQYWLTGQRGGLLPYDWVRFLPYWLKPPQLWLSLLLPVLLGFPRQFPLMRSLRERGSLLLQVLLVSLGLFFLAHGVLFKLYLPSRYTQYNLRILAAIAGAIVLVALINVSMTWIRQRSSVLPRTMAVAGLVLVVSWVIAYPAFRPLIGRSFPDLNYKVGQFPALYQFLAQQPKDMVIASLDNEANNLPTFAQRSVLVAQEYAIPYHKGYYREIRQRVLDLLEAQYNPDQRLVNQVIQKYQIDFWLLSTHAFQPQYIEKNGWLMQYQPTATQSIVRLQQGIHPALASSVDRCTVFHEQTLVVLSAPCLVSKPVSLHHP